MIQIVSIWGTIIYNSASFLEFRFFLCPSVCSCHALYVSVPLFTVKLNFLKAHYSYRPSQLVYGSLVSDLALQEVQIAYQNT